LTAVRRADEHDARLLVQWHADPEIARYWDYETYTHEQMLERLRGDEVESFIIERALVPSGSCRYGATTTPTMAAASTCS
jgi:RimJ/RimL family protein N-acetyltransferase